MQDRTWFGFARNVRSFWRAPVSWTQLLWAEHLIRAGQRKAEKGLLLLEKATARLKALGIGIKPTK